MKDSINHHKSSSIISDVKALSSVIPSRKTKVFIYGLVLSFVACTAYLALFNPSGSTSFGTKVPWFNNLFSSAASSTAPYRSQVSSFFSHFLPNSSSLPSPEQRIQYGQNGAFVDKKGVPNSENQFQPSGDSRNKSEEASRVEPTKDEGLKRKNESIVGSQGSKVSGNETSDVSLRNGTGDGSSTKVHGSLNLKNQSESRNQPSTAAPPVASGVPVKKDGNTKKQSVNGDPAVAMPPTQEVKKEGGSKKDGNTNETNGTTSNNQLTNGSQGNSPAPRNPASTVSAAPGGTGNKTGIAALPSQNGVTATKSQGSSDTYGSSAPVPSGSKSSASSGTKKDNPGKSTPNASGSQAAINTKSSENSNSNNLTLSLAKGNENSKGTANTALNAEPERKIDLTKSMIGCDMFHGKWVKDDSYPLYPEGSCPHIDEPFDCYHNGRPDRNYQKLRWQPHGCKIPRFNAIDMLERLRGKRLVFVGDSLNRNMWESLVCALRHSIKDKLKVFEASGRHEFKTEGSYSFLFTDYNCSVEFFRSPFLVREWEMPLGNNTKKETLRIDLIEKSSSKYKDADFLVFNTGHWWTHEKTSAGKDYYQEGNHVYSELNVLDAFRKAVNTWAKWIDTNVNSKKTLVLFRGYSASHFSGGQWNSGGACDKETEPIKDEKYLTTYPPIMRVLEDVINGMKTPVGYLNITRMTDYRKDAHPSIYRKQNLTEEERRSPERYQDCSHWCLPGVPDSWNELLYAQILVKQYQMIGK
ncbi:Protein trichome birefringence [Rhynchospora pubera]|uniref:Protein trichome birefringence n=1 Tax=Rhynchospora pubera TaxID=906938 RepID=A0AAV8DTC7_9POAL|nr:Protein trichome birefringence [Rhynchospora pubera]